MWHYQQAFAAHGRRVAQVLLTQEDISDRSRFLDARNTLLTLLAHGVLPVINENDTVAVEEIKVGDNDNLAALVAYLVEADLLVLLSDTDGLYTGDPHRDPEARRIDPSRSSRPRWSEWRGPRFPSAPQHGDEASGGPKGDGRRHPDGDRRRPPRRRARRGAARRARRDVPSRHERTGSPPASAGSPSRSRPRARCRWTPERGGPSSSAARRACCRPGS